MLDDTLDLSYIALKPPSQYQGKRNTVPQGASLNHILKEIDQIDLEEAPKDNRKIRIIPQSTKGPESFAADNLLMETHQGKVTFSSKTHNSNRESLLKLKVRPSMKSSESRTLDMNWQGPGSINIINKNEVDKQQMGSPSLAMMFKKSKDSTGPSLLLQQDNQSQLYPQPVYMGSRLETIYHGENRSSPFGENNLEDSSPLMRKKSLPRGGRNYRESPTQGFEEEAQMALNKMIKRAETDDDVHSPALPRGIINELLEEHSREHRLQKSQTVKIHLPKINAEINLLTKIPLETKIDLKTPSHYQSEQYRLERETPVRMRNSLAANFENCFSPKRMGQDSPQKLLDTSDNRYSGGGHFKRSSMGASIGSKTLAPVGSDHILKNILERRSNKESLSNLDYSGSRGDKSPNSLKALSAGQSPQIVSNEGQTRQIRRIEDRSSIFKKLAESELVKTYSPDSQPKKAPSNY